MSQIIITPKSEKDIRQLLKLLKSMDAIKSVRLRKPEVKLKKMKVNEEALMSEKSLSKEWESEEDDRWDDLLK